MNNCIFISEKKYIYIYLTSYCLFSLCFPLSLVASFNNRERERKPPKLLCLYLKQIGTEKRLRSFEVEEKKSASVAFAFPLQ